VLHNLLRFRMHRGVATPGSKLTGKISSEAILFSIFNPTVFVFTENIETRRNVKGFIKYGSITS
jgi:hypothetical protein